MTAEARPHGRHDAGHVFTIPTGEPWHPDRITRASDRLVTPASKGERHTHASHLLAAGVNVKMVSDHLGHASVVFTLDTCAHVMPGQQADAAAASAALLGRSVINL